MTGPAEASQPFVPPPPKKPKHRGRIVAAVIGGVAVVAIVVATVDVTRIGASSEVTSGGKGYVVCACETKILPKNSQGKKIKSFTVELAPATGKGKSYTIKVDGEDGFAIEDFGELPDQKYQMTITSGKGANPHSECNRILRGSRPGATYDDACEDMHHWRHHGRLQPS